MTVSENDPSINPHKVSTQYNTLYNTHAHLHLNQRLSTTTVVGLTD